MTVVTAPSEWAVSEWIGSFAVSEWIGGCVPAVFSSVSGFITGPPAPPGAGELTRKCQRELTRMMRDNERALGKYKARTGELKTKIRNASAKKGAKRTDRDIVGSAYELHLLNRDQNKLFCFNATLKTLRNELSLALAQMRRDQAIEGSVAIMRLMNDLNPPATVAATMSTFAKQMQIAGFIDDEIAAAFDRHAAKGEDDDEEVTNEELDAIISVVVDKSPATRPQRAVADDDRVPAAWTDEQVTMMAGYSPAPFEMPLPRAQRNDMQKRLDALRS